MSYENAPATAMLATHCAMCSRPLVDAQSVETGIGPVCRDKYLVPDAVSNEARTEGNKLIHKIALLQKGPEVKDALKRLSDLGFTKVVKRINKRIKGVGTAPIELSYHDGRIFIKTPYLGAMFGDYLKACQSIPGRRWNAAEKANTFPIAEKRSVWEMMQEFFKGHDAKGPKGEFVIA